GGRSGVEDGLEQLRLRAGEVEVLDVTAFARGAAAEQAGEVAQGEDDDVRVGGGIDGIGDRIGLAAVERGARDVGDLGAAQLRGEGLEQGADLDARGRAGVLHADVRG